MGKTFRTQKDTNSGFSLNDEYDRELEKIRKRKLEEMSMTEITGDWPSSPVDITDAEFMDFIKRYQHVVVDCWAPWCGPCQMLGPVIEELASDYKGKIAFGKLNTDENQATPVAHGIMSIPTLLFFKNGELVHKTTGAMPREALESALGKHF